MASSSQASSPGRSRPASCHLTVPRFPCSHHAAKTMAERLASEHKATPAPGILLCHLHHTVLCMPALNGPRCALPPLTCCPGTPSRHVLRHLPWTPTAAWCLSAPGAAVPTWPHASACPPATVLQRHTVRVACRADQLPESGPPAGICCAVWKHMVVGTAQLNAAPLACCPLSKRDPPARLRLLTGRMRCANASPGMKHASRKLLEGLKATRNWQNDASLASMLATGS
jgi:hypothetical protein